MKTTQEQLAETLDSMKNGLLNLEYLEKINLNEIFTFLQNPNISENEITALDISSYRNWEEVENFILKLNNNSSFKPQSIIINRFPIYAEKVFNLKLKTDIKIDNLNKRNDRKNTLFKKFLEEFKKNNFNLEEEKITKFIKNACKEAKSPDNIEMQYMQALRIFSNFDFAKIDTKYFNLNPIFTKLYKAQEVKSEIYHYKQQDDLHFYVVKVNGANKKAWNEFLSEQSNFASFYRGNDPVIKNASMGLKAFRSSIDLFDEDLTEVYVAFASNKIWDQKNNIDTSSIEMFITMDTSENAKFISHVGISRAPIY